MIVYEVKCKDENCHFKIQSATKSMLREMAREHKDNIGHEVGKIRVIEKDGKRINPSNKQ